MPISGVVSAEYAVSDLLIVLDGDGRTHTVQHTVASGGPSLKLRLPGSIIPQELMVFGAGETSPLASSAVDQKIIDVSENKSAFARYQHQYASEVDQITPGNYMLTTNSVPDNSEFDAGTLTRSAMTWVFPIGFEVVAYTVTDPAVGRWVSNNNTLTYHQLGSVPVKLSINYKNKAHINQSEQILCSDISPPTDACAEDLDEDGVPDYRDICMGKIGEPGDSFGCTPNKTIVLSDIVFQTGRTYLDLAARNLLDRTAYAILTEDNRFYEVGAHTDNVGSANSNQQLSQKRAEAVRHYLMLRGVSPNTLSATGYGEKYPIRDNATQEGKRANRRVELVRVQR